MSGATYRISRDDRSFRQRLFEPPAVGKMSLLANLVASAILLFWSLFVLFPIYWVVITAFKNAETVNNGPFFIPFVDFQPTLKGWIAQFATDPHCDAYSVGRQLFLLVYNLFAFILSPIVKIEKMEPQICKVYLAYTNSFVISFGATALSASASGILVADFPRPDRVTSDALASAPELALAVEAARSDFEAEFRAA